MSIIRALKGQEVMISIIVPVYKVEKYLPACVESILAQTCRDFELILVDDGSPDGCGGYVTSTRARTRAFAWCIKKMEAFRTPVTPGSTSRRENISRSSTVTTACIPSISPGCWRHSKAMAQISQPASLYPFPTGSSPFQTVTPVGLTGRWIGCRRWNIYFWLCRSGAQSLHGVSFIKNIFSQISGFP